MALFNDDQLFILHKIFEELSFRIYELLIDIDDDFVQVVALSPGPKRMGARMSPDEACSAMANAFPVEYANVGYNIIYEETTRAAFTDEQLKILGAALGHIWTRAGQIHSMIMFNSARLESLLETLTRKRVVTREEVEELPTTVQVAFEGCNHTIYEEATKAAFTHEQFRILEVAVTSACIRLDDLTNGLQGHRVRVMRTLRALLEILTKKRVVTPKQVKKAFRTFQSMDPLRPIRHLCELRIASSILDGETDAFMRVVEQERKGTRQREFEAELEARGELKIE